MECLGSPVRVPLQVAVHVLNVGSITGVPTNTLVDFHNGASATGR